jgi:hypothetical protein
MRRLIPVLAIVFSAVSLHAQVTIQQGTTLSQLINNLYGGDGIQLKNTGHEAHFGETADFQQFTAALQKTLQARPLFPVPSSVGAVSYKFNEESGTYDRVQGSFGPLLSERATTSGRGHANFSTSFTVTDFENVNGRDTVGLTLRHCLTVDCTFGNPAAAFLNDVIHVDVHLKLKSQVLATSVVYGLTDRFDVGVVVPYIRNDLNVFTHAYVIVAPGSNPAIHQFDPTVETADQMASGHAIGIGDIIARGKVQLGLRVPFQTAFLADVTIPSGDKNNFLGTGDLRVKGTLIASKSAARFSPHVNIGYEWNTNNAKLSSVDYRAGSEVLLTPRLTFAGDLLGTVQPSTATDLRVTALEGESLIGRSQMDLAVGFKWEMRPGSLLTFNYLRPVNTTGIRPNAGISLGWQLGI